MVDSVRLRYYEEMTDGRQRELFRYSLAEFDDIPRPEGFSDVPMSGTTPRTFANQLTVTSTVGSYIEGSNANDQVGSACDVITRWAAIPNTLYRRSRFSEAMGYHWWRLANQQFLNTASRMSSSEDRRDGTSDEPPEDTDDLQVMVKSAANAAKQVQENLRSQSHPRPWRPHMAELLPYLLRDLFEAQDDTERSHIERGLSNLTFASFLRNLTHHLQQHSWAQEMVWSSVEEGFGEGISWSSYMLHQLFDVKVKYLGPLRKAPQVLYDPRLRDLDLGLSGEIHGSYSPCQCYSSCGPDKRYRCFGASDAGIRS